MRYINLIGWWIRLMIARCRRYYDGPSHPSIDIVSGTPEYVPMPRQLNIYGVWEYATSGDYDDDEIESTDYAPPIGMNPLFHSVVSPRIFQQRHRTVFQLNFADQAIPVSMIPKHPKDFVQENREIRVYPVAMATLFQL
ncbi:MAG: hypothetical protein WCG99_04170 [Candidatus Berkelbacteria bacterium]